jgi:hypothetical protein
MPILNRPLDQHGHVLVDLVVVPSQSRLTALQAAIQPPPPQLVGSALIDTGASITVIDPTIRQSLNLVPFRVRRVAVPGAAAPIRAFSYKVDLLIFDPAPSAVYRLIYSNLSVVEAAITHTGASVLVGCDVLSRCHLTYNGVRSDFTLAY